MGNRLDAGLLEGVHVPVEDTASHRDGHSLQAVGNGAGVFGGIAPLAQVDDVAVLAQVDELSPVGLYWYSQFQLTCMTSEP